MGAPCCLSLHPPIRLSIHPCARVHACVPVRARWKLKRVCSREGRCGEQKAELLTLSPEAWSCGGNLTILNCAAHLKIVKLYHYSFSMRERDKNTVFLNWKIRCNLAAND